VKKEERLATEDSSYRNHRIRDESWNKMNVILGAFLEQPTHVIRYYYYEMEFFFFLSNHISIYRVLKIVNFGIKKKYVM
jgi:hypothetical protein